MRAARYILLLILVALAGCSTPHSKKKSEAKKDTPETVLVVYHVRAGAETEFLATLMSAWDLYRSEHLVYAEPHVVFRQKEGMDQSRVMEIFTWVNHAAPAHAPQKVKEIWEKEHSYCEDRGGRPGIDGDEVELLLPGNK